MVSLLYLVLSEMEKHLDSHPDDWNVRLILADALEDAGEDKRAEFQRVLVKRKKHPTYGQSLDDVWDWWVVRHDPHSNLGRAVCEKILGMRQYKSRQDAEGELMQAWLEGHWPEEVDSPSPS